MEERPERVEQFKEEIASMRLRDPSTVRDRQLLRLGIALMVLGVVLGVVAYSQSHSTTNALQQRDAIVLALIGVSTTVAGGAVFVRYSVAQFLRFWLARLTYEQQAQTDRVVEAIKPPAD
jgi:negative regulator of sigma E activity